MLEPMNRFENISVTMNDSGSSCGSGTHAERQRKGSRSSSVRATTSGQRKWKPLAMSSYMSLVSVIFVFAAITVSVMVSGAQASGQTVQKSAEFADEFGIQSDGQSTADYGGFLARVKRHVFGSDDGPPRTGDDETDDALTHVSDREARRALPYDRDFGRVFSYRQHLTRYPEPPREWFKDRYDSFNTAWIDRAPPRPPHKPIRPLPTSYHDEWRDRFPSRRPQSGSHEDGWIKPNDVPNRDRFPSYRPSPPDRFKDRPIARPPRPDKHQHFDDVHHERPGDQHTDRLPPSRPSPIIITEDNRPSGESSDRITAAHTASSTDSIKKVRPPWQQGANTVWGPTGPSSSSALNTQRLPEPPPGTFDNGPTSDPIAIVGSRDPLSDPGFLAYLADELETSPEEVLVALTRPVPAGYTQQQQEFLQKLYAEYLVKNAAGGNQPSVQQQLQEVPSSSTFETTTPFFPSSTPQQQQDITSISPNEAEPIPGTGSLAVTENSGENALLVDNSGGGDGVNYNRQFVNLPGGDIEQVFRFCGCPPRADHVCGADGWNYVSSCVLRCMTARWQHLRDCHMYKTGVTGRIFDMDNNRPYVMRENFGDERRCQVSIAALEGMCGVEFKRIDFHLGNSIEDCADNFLMLDGTKHCLDGDTFPDVVRFNAEMRVDLTYKLENLTQGFDLFYSQVPCEPRLDGGNAANYRRASPCEIYLSGPTGRFMSNSLKVNDWGTRCRVTVVAEDNRCGLELKFNNFSLIRSRQCQDEYFKIAGKRYCGRGPHLMPSEAAFDGKFQLPFEFRLNSNGSEIDFFFRQLSCETLATKGISVRHEGQCTV